MTHSVLNGYIMVQKGIFWTIEEHSYFFIIPLYPIKGSRSIGLNGWIWEYSAGKMVSVENSVLLNTVVLYCTG